MGGVRGVARSGLVSGVGATFFLEGTDTKLGFGPGGSTHPLSLKLVDMSITGRKSGILMFLAM